MAKLIHANHPELKKYWDSYGHSIPFEQLDGIKFRSDGCYVILRWKEPDGMVNMADLVRGGRDMEWDMQNDGFEPITEKQWNKLRIVPECDWFEIPE